MRILIAGSSGLIGTELVRALRADRHEVRRLVRRAPSGPDEFQWDPPQGYLDAEALAGAGAAINLCGAGIGDKRWSAQYKQQLRASRIVPTAVLAGAVAEAGVPLLINSNGANYYGPGDAPVTESDGPGDGFLSTLCVDWEAATAPAAAAGARTVVMRTGVVLSPHGGLLGQLRPLYRLGLGARLGSGDQYFPWVSLSDLLGVIRFALKSELAGPVNVVGPQVVTNAIFHRELARAVHRPAWLVAPGAAVRLALGEFADEAVLTGPCVIPASLVGQGYQFQQQTLAAALDAALNRGPHDHP